MMDEFITVISLLDHIEPTTSAARTAQVNGSLDVLQVSFPGLYDRLTQLLDEDSRHSFQSTELSERAMKCYRRRVEGSFGGSLASYCSHVNDEEEFHQMLNLRGFSQPGDIPELDSS